MWAKPRPSCCYFCTRHTFHGPKFKQLQNWKETMRPLYGPLDPAWGGHACQALGPRVPRQRAGSCARRPRSDSVSAGRAPAPRLRAPGTHTRRPCLPPPADCGSHSPRRGHAHYLFQPSSRKGSSLLFCVGPGLLINRVFSLITDSLFLSCGSPSCEVVCVVAAGVWELLAGVSVPGRGGSHSGSSRVQKALPSALALPPGFILKFSSLSRWNRFGVCCETASV